MSAPSDTAYLAARALRPLNAKPSRDRSPPHPHELSDISLRFFPRAPRQVTAERNARPTLQLVERTWTLLSGC